MNDVDITCDMKNKLSEVWFFIIFTFHFKLFFAMGVWWWGRGILVLVTGEEDWASYKVSLTLVSLTLTYFDNV